ncbi:hypothetical protein THOG05_330025 [Vibrio rotiferianus]|nr:hypothetical protein THOG05_330025 [Vibrio rotiferianus]
MKTQTEQLKAKSMNAILVGFVQSAEVTKEEVECQVLASQRS